MKCEGRLRKADILTIIRRATKVFGKSLMLKSIAEEPNMLSIQDPICVFGDLHGHFFDLLNMLQQVEYVTKYKYLTLF